MINGGFTTTDKQNTKRLKIIIRKLDELMYLYGFNDICEKIFLLYAKFIKETESEEFGYKHRYMENIDVEEFRKNIFPFYLENITKFDDLKKEYHELKADESELESNDSKREYIQKYEEILHKLVDRLEPEDIVYKIKFYLFKKIRHNSDAGKIFINEINDIFEHIDKLYKRTGKNTEELKSLYDEIKKSKEEFYTKYPKSESKTNWFGKINNFIKTGTTKKRKGGKRKTRKNKK